MTWIRFLVARGASVGLASAATTNAVEPVKPSELVMRPIQAPEIQILMIRSRTRKCESDGDSVPFRGESGMMNCGEPETGILVAEGHYVPKNWKAARSVNRERAEDLAG
jgi:hypothetical protein